MMQLERNHIFFENETLNTDFYSFKVVLFTKLPRSVIKSVAEELSYFHWENNTELVLLFVLISSIA